MNLTTKTEDGASGAIPSTGQSRTFLFLVLHRDRPALGGARYELAGIDTVEIGRGHERRAGRPEPGHLVLELPGTRISKRHVQLTRRPDKSWNLRDLGSRNGTFVNGQRVERATLQDGDVLEVGAVILRFRLGLPTSGRVGPGVPQVAGSSGTAPLGFASLVPAVAHELDQLARIARTQVPTLLTGEIGSGRKLLARGMHDLSGRPGPFVLIRCGALTDSRLTRQLFGQVQGATPGTSRDEPGSLRRAHTGTVLLDEVGELPLPAQDALLRFLREKAVTPVGGDRSVSVDVRVISVTHKPLDEMALDDRFRGDLLAQLAGYRHAIPPLRQRLEDLGLLLGEILGRPEVVGGDGLTFSVEAVRALLAHRWPFNIHELAHAMAVASALTETGIIDAQHLPRDVRSASTEHGTRERPASSPRVLNPEQQLLRKQLIGLLEEKNGNITHVASSMGKARMQIHRWMRALGIDANDYR